MSEMKTHSSVFVRTAVPLSLFFTLLLAGSTDHCFVFFSFFGFVLYSCLVLPSHPFVKGISFLFYFIFEQDIAKW